MSAVNEELCFHEAAHAVVAWMFGVEIAEVRVMSTADWKRRIPLKSTKGVVHPGKMGYTEYKKTWFASGTRAAPMVYGVARKHLCNRMIIALAGPVACDLYINKKGLIFQFIMGGEDDRNTFESVISYGRFSEKESARLIKTAYRLLAMQPVNNALVDTSRALYQDCSISGSRLKSLCSKVFRRYPRRRLYMKLWPIRFAASTRT